MVVDSQLYSCPESSYSAFLFNNVAPTDSESQDIQNSIKSSAQKINFIDKEIAQLLRSVDLLRSKRTALEQFVQSYRGVVSVVRRLPSDILLEIFSHCVDPKVSAFSQTSTLPKIAGVCQLWREVALGASFLWRNIHILDAHVDWFDNRQAELAALQIKFSTPAPLCVRLEFQSTDETSLDSMSLLLAERARWQDLHLITFEPHLQHLLKFCFPTLENIRLHLNCPLPRDFSFPSERFPALTSLKLVLGSQSLPHGLNSLWPQLRNLELQGGTPREFLHILPFLSPGTHFSFVGRRNFRDQLIPVCTAISSLSLKDCHPEDTGIIFAAITASRLTRVAIGVRYDWEKLFPCITTFITRSLCTLTHMRTSINSTSYPRINVFFQHLCAFLRSAEASHVVDLDIDLASAPIPTPLIEALADLDVAPSLQALALRRCQFLRDAAVLELQARRPALKELWLESSGLLAKDTIRALNAGGVEVIILAKHEKFFTRWDA